MKKSWSTESFELSTDNDQFRMTDRRSAAFERRPQPKTAIELGASAPKLLRTARKVTLLVVQRRGGHRGRRENRLNLIGCGKTNDFWKQDFFNRESFFSAFSVSSAPLCLALFSSLLQE